MSKPASPASSTLDHHATPEDITQLRDQARSAIAGCCKCTFRRDQTFSSHDKIVQLGKDTRTQNSRGEVGADWPAEVFVESADGESGTVTVNVRFWAVNATSNTRDYPGTIAMSDADVEARVAKIPPGIERAWNARPYFLRIKDRRCGERRFLVRFVVQAFMRGGGHHYKLNFVNVPGGMGEDAPLDVRRVATGRSYILPSTFGGKFNFLDDRTVTDNVGERVLEPHEFGHMIGLRDEYHDDEYDRGGVAYEFPDGTREVVQVGPRDRIRELMGSMDNPLAMPTRYCVTVAYAAITVLEHHGCSVSDCVIE